VVESLRERNKRRTAQAVADAALRLFERRGFEQTTIADIASAAEISRRTFFRYFADKEELFFAEDERLLETIQEALDHSPKDEPLLDLARRATRALAARSVVDPQRRLTRERLVAASPALQDRRMAKNARWEQVVSQALRERGHGELQALLIPKLAMACFQSAYERWVRDPSQDLSTLVDESFTALANLQGSSGSRK
jgi:AcrR family transcriptional regulator